jgi:hypothetical protein
MRGTTGWSAVLAAVFVVSCVGVAPDAAAATVGTTATVSAASTVPALISQPAAKGPRPANGAVLARRGARGEGTLDVDNGTDVDAYVTIARNGNLVLGMYVRGGEKARATDIADGTYMIYFSSGTGWNSDLLAFTADRQYTKFDEPFDYVTTRTTSAAWEVGLQPTVGGTAETTDISGADIPT